MLQALTTINNLLSDMDIAPINEMTAKQWFIEGGESLDELIAMANCYAGEIGEQQAQKQYYAYTVQC